MLGPTSQRRNLLLAGGFIFLILILLYSSPSVDASRFKQIIPTAGDKETTQADKTTTDDEKKKPVAESGDDKSDDKPDDKESDKEADQLGEEEEIVEVTSTVAAAESKVPDAKIEIQTAPAMPTTDPYAGNDETAAVKPTAGSKKPSSSDDSESEEPSEEDASGIKTSKFHYLIPASGPNQRLCFNLLSSAAARYPVPALMGWNGKGLFDAAETHLAKLRAIMRYLDSLPEEEDDDIVLIVDGYDVILQLGPELMLKRYFDTLEAENQRTAKRFGISMDEVFERNLQTTLFFGPDKICWPINWAAPRCWSVPKSTLANDAFGPKTNNGDMRFMIPRWLNSGTLIGPASHMRDYVEATLDEIKITYDPTYKWKESDQYYLANIWGRQEYYRSLQEKKDKKDVPGGPKDRFYPREKGKDENVEYHVGIEYESAMFQTKAGYEPFVGWLHYNGSESENPKAWQDKDCLDLKEKFKPYNIEMPEDVQTSLGNIYEDIADAHPDTTTSQWLRDVVLGTNFVTKHIFALWHVTGDKNVIEKQYTMFWYYPYARSLLKAAVKAVKGDTKIHKETIGGRYWIPKTVYPEEVNGKPAPELGGAWSDEEEGGKYVPWEDMCGEWDDYLFAGEDGTKESSKDTN